MPLGKRVTIIGGELVGCELAEFLLERGREVTIIGDAPQFGGSGQGVAMEFARAGCHVAICYRSKDDVALATAEAIAATGVKASVHKLDVRDRASVETAETDAITPHKHIHSVIWGAGPLVPQIAISEWSEDQFRQAVEVELFGFFNAARAFIAHFREQGGGSFVHLGSAGHDWWPKLDGLSVAPKAASEALIKGIAKEEGKYGIRANPVLVGVIEAGMFDKLREEGAIDDRWIMETKKLRCLKFFEQARDIGQAAVFFTSDRARYVTGQTISVSGGFEV